MNRELVRPEVLQWMLERAEMDLHTLKSRFPEVPAWELGEKKSNPEAT